MGSPKVFSGARAIIHINDALVVYAMSVSWEISADYKPIQTVDNVTPDELVPTNFEVTITCEVLRVPKISASTLGLQPTILNMLHQQYAAIELRDRKTNDTIIYIPRAMLVKRSSSAETRKLSAETWTFKGIGYWDERTPIASQMRKESGFGGGLPF